MERKDRIDLFGAASLTGFAVFLAFGQIVAKLVNAGLQPAFFAGIRSVIAAAALWVWMVWRGRPPRFRREMLGPGLLIGVCFAGEFLALFLALDLTTVTRTGILFYSMPVWMALAAHVLLPGERLTLSKGLGLALALGGVALAILDRGAGAAAAPSLAGDLCALAGAIGWATTALMVRVSRLREERPEMQLMWQVLVSGPVLLVAAPLLGPVLGPVVRSPDLWTLAGLFYHALVIVAAGFLLWLWLMSIYPASSVASFSFLSPVFAVILGWLLLGERIGPAVIAALGLVAAGMVLINRAPRRRAAVPPSLPPSQPGQDGAPKA